MARQAQASASRVRAPGPGNLSATRRKLSRLDAAPEAEASEDGGPSAERKGWHALRFTEDSRKVSVVCAGCGIPMWLPASKVSMYKTCGPSCRNRLFSVARESRRRECETCSKVFYPRQVQLTNGGGRFCSQNREGVFFGILRPIDTSL